MHRSVFAAALLLAMFSSAPSYAVSPKDKMATCKFGADDQKLRGAARDAFMRKCMSNHDDPRGPGPASAGMPPPRN